MFICPVCFRQYLIGEGWLPPPCIFKSSHTIRELSEQNKCVFTHIECQCGQHIGVKVISGPKKNIGYWRLQFDCEQIKEGQKDDFMIAKTNFTNAELKHIYQTELTNRIYKILDVHIQNKARIFMIQRMAKKLSKNPKTNSV